MTGTDTKYLPLPTGQLVPLDSMGMPDFGRMIAGAPLNTQTPANGASAPAAAPTGPVLAFSNTPTFRTGVTTLDPRWLLAGFLLLLLISKR
jgi:hypothetical protein